MKKDIESKVLSLADFYKTSPYIIINKMVTELFDNIYDSAPKEEKNIIKKLYGKYYNTYNEEDDVFEDNNYNYRNINNF